MRALKIVCLGVWFALVVSTLSQIQAQTLGDYRSIASGNWSSFSTWQYYNGTAWVAATSYPGQIATINNVTVRSPHVVTVDVDPNANVFQMDNMTVNVGATLRDLAVALDYQIAPSISFSISGTVDLDNTTILTSSIYSSLFTISASGVLSAHVVFLQRVNNSGTATVTQRIVNIPPINTALNQGVWLNLANSTLNFGGISMEAALRANSSNNTVNYYSATSDQTVRAPVSSYFNLTLSGAGGRSKTLVATTAVLSTVAMQGNSNFSLGGFNLSVGGDWNDTSTGSVAVSNTTVTFNGTIQQNIFKTTGTTTFFHNLVINNSSTTSPQITSFSINLNVAQTLTMQRGNINLNGNYITHGPAGGLPGILLHSGAASAGWIYGGIYNRSFQDGVTISNGSVNGLFPVGTSQNFRPLYISSPTVAINNANAQVLVSNATNVTDVNIPDTGGPIVRQHQGSWQVTLSASSGLFNISAGGTGFLYIGNINDLRLSLASSVVGSAGVNSGTPAFPLVQRTGLSIAQLNNTFFYLGSVNNITSPLPVELVSFTGEAEGNGVNLNWVTRTELNCDYFTVYRSHNGVDFVPVATRKGAATTKEQRTYEVQDSNPWKGINYYRLEQTDFDGTKNSLSLLSVEANGTEAIQFYPTQVSRGENIHLQLQGLAPEAQLQIHLVNTMGQTMDQYAIQTDQEGRFYGDVQIGDVSTGFYYLKLNQTIMKIMID